MKVFQDEKIYGEGGYLKSHEIIIDLKEDGKGSILGDAIYTIICADALQNTSAFPMDEVTMLKVESRIESAIELLKEELKRMETWNR